MKFDIAVIGGSLGGVQAAVSGARENKRVYLCEESDWVGGQLTSQGVPPDEHSWIESFGCTERYRRFRQQVRDHYAAMPEFDLEAAKRVWKLDFGDSEAPEGCFSPGNAWVSRIPHEPEVAVKLLEDMMEEYVRDGRIVLDYFTVAQESRTEGDAVVSVTVRNLKTGERKEIEAAYFVDATDCGDLLPIVGAEYRTGAESKNQTGEPDAADAPDPADMQAITWVAALETVPEGEDWIPEKPEGYDRYAALEVPHVKCRQLGWHTNELQGPGVRRLGMYDGEGDEGTRGLWNYRRIIDASNFKDDRNEIMLLNWPQNDYWMGNVIDDPDGEKHLQEARELTLCAVYWLQTEALRPDGGRGYRVRLCPRILGTPDGLAKMPYIRESRRIVAKRTVREQEIVENYAKKPLTVEDSVGVGHYSMDLHLTTGSNSHFMARTYPFEIPFSAMVPVRLKNLLPACKNIGCTHLTGGCYRLHPVEWNIGEAAGYAAAYCIDRKVTPAQLLEAHIKEFQAFLEERGIQLHWDFSRMTL
ncbi:MAG: FAD-dependent oxidoreductase [Lachnospiraceae bacterium]|jgi:hypothetical protein|nr:FAD-dependent oxidoreductase [Lachnospiraceae bacterium]